MQFPLDLLKLVLEHTSLPSRVKNTLSRNGVQTIGDLVYHVEHGQLDALRGVGPKTKGEIDEFLYLLVTDPQAATRPQKITISAVEDYSVDQTLLLKARSIADMPIRNTPMRIRVRNSLQRAGILTVGQMVKRIQDGTILAVRNFGEKSLHEAISFLERATTTAIPAAADWAQTHGTDGHQIMLDLDRLPISFWAPFLTQPQYIRLLRSGLSRAGQLVSLDTVTCKVDASLPKAIIEKAKKTMAECGALDRASFYRKSLQAHQAYLQERIDRGILHPDILVSGRPLKAYLEWDPKSYELAHSLHICCLINKSPQLAFELEEVFDLAPREVQVLMLRHGPVRQTLEEVGAIFGVTRERIRQIESRALRRIWQLLEQPGTILLKSALKFARDQEKAFSFRAWMQDMKSRGILGAVYLPSLPHGTEIKAEDLLVVLIRTSKKLQYGKRMVSDEIRAALRMPSLSVRSIEAIEGVTSAKRRRILRKIGYTGGIHISEAEEELGLSRLEAGHYLQTQGLISLLPEWYTYQDSSAMARASIRTAGLKLFEACGPLPVDEILDGLRSYASRFYPALAPKPLIEHMLDLCGFELRDGKVHYPRAYSSRLSGSERLFLQLLEEYGDAISFSELVMEFLSRGYSMAGATIGLLSHSPLPVRIDPSPDRFAYYTLRGREVTWDQLEAASARQAKVALDAEVEYRRDGTIRYLATLNTWAVFSGVLAVHALPNISGEWSVFASGQTHGKCSMDQNFMWGLNSVFGDLQAQVGDRVEVIFNSWDRTATFRKLDEND